MLLQGGSDLPEAMDAAYGSMLMKRLLLHHLNLQDALDIEKASMDNVLAKCGRESCLPWLVAAAVSMCKVGLMLTSVLLYPGGI